MRQLDLNMDIDDDGDDDGLLAELHPLVLLAKASSVYTSSIREDSLGKSEPIGLLP